MTPLQPPPTIKVGFRFAQKDLNLLKFLAREERNRGLPSDLFSKAADATEHNDVLEVLGATKEEVEQLADGFILYGLQRPAIEERRSGPPRQQGRKLI